MFSTVVYDDEEDRERERERETAPQRRGLVKRGERSHFYSRRFFFVMKRGSSFSLGDLGGEKNAKERKK